MVSISPTIFYLKIRQELGDDLNVFALSFSNCHVTSHCSRDERVMWLKVWEPLAVRQHLALFGDYGSSASGNKLYLIYHVI